MQTNMLIDGQLVAGQRRHTSPVAGSIDSTAVGSSRVSERML